MTAWTALSRALAAVTNTARCTGYARRDERLRRTERALADQIHANGELAAKLAKRDERIKALKEREATLTGVIVTVLWQRGQAAHQARRLEAVAGGAAEGGEAA